MAAVARVAVVGGGIAGLATALALHRRGLEAVVLERAPALRELGAGIALWPNATRALRDLGILEAVSLRSGPAESIQIQSPTGHTLLRFSTSRPDAPSICVVRRDLVSVLEAALPSRTVRYGATFNSAAATARGIQVTTSDGDLEVDLLVGADGLRSRVRDSLIENVEPVSQRFVAWRAVSTWPEDVGSDAIEMWGDGRRFGLFRLDHDRAYWYALATEDPGESSSRSDLAELERVFAEWHPRVLKVVGNTEGEIARHDVFDRPPSKQWASGRVVLVGDAAHGMTPDLGQGGAQGLEDAVALSRWLDLEDDLDVALAGYVRERMRRAVWIQRQSRYAGQLGQLSGVAGRVRNAVARATPSRLFEAGFTAAF